jgi:hypothetical protein
MRHFFAITSLLVALLAGGCISIPGAAHVTGKFVHRDTGTYAVFQESGRFYYSFRSATPVLSSDGLPRRSGHYWFDQAADTTPNLGLNSFDAGQFTIRFSESHDRFHLVYPELFAGERVYERVDMR